MSLTEISVKFKGIERTVQRICHEIGRETLKAVLEEWDRCIMQTVMQIHNIMANFPAVLAVRIGLNAAH